MIRYSKEERTRIMQIYIRTMSIKEVQRDYRIRFKTRISPSKNIIKSLYRKFAENKPRSERKKSNRTEDAIERVAVNIRDYPKTSTRKRASQLSISQRTLCRILKKGLKVEALQNSVDSKVIA